MSSTALGGEVANTVPLNSVSEPVHTHKPHVTREGVFCITCGVFLGYNMVGQDNIAMYTPEYKRLNRALEKRFITHVETSMYYVGYVDQRAIETVISTIKQIVKGLEAYGVDSDRLYYDAMEVLRREDIREMLKWLLEVLPNILERMGRTFVPKHLLCGYAAYIVSLAESFPYRGREINFRSAKKWLKFLRSRKYYSWYLFVRRCYNMRIFERRDVNMLARLVEYTSNSP